MKVCTVCSVELTLDNQKEYHRKNYVHKCISCVREVSRVIANKSYKKNTEYLLDRSAKHRAKLKKDNPKRYTVKQMLGSASKRAKKKGIEFDLDIDFVLNLCVDVCPILNIELKYGGAKDLKASASLDRKDSSLGYTKDNVWVISSLSNTMKSDASFKELSKFGDWCASLEGSIK